MPANPLATNLEALLASLRQSEDGTPAQLVGFIARDGAVHPIPGDTVPFSGAIAAASADGHSGIKPATKNGDNVKILADLYGRLWSRIALSETDATTDAAGEISRTYTQTDELDLVEYAGLNLAGSTMYLMVFDADALPANGTVPLITAVPVAAGEFGSVELEGGRHMDTGIVVAFSSTPLALTVTTTLSSYTIVYR